jgi:ketosteroid isomerase-like protein
VYKAIARRRIRSVFDAISRGDIEAATRDLADDVHHVFPGDHPLGGERHSREAMQRWFQRLFVLFPEIEFEVDRIAVRGWPWDMQIAVQWSDHGKAADGEPYENEGAHWIRIRRGKGVYVHAYLDTKRVSDACDRMAAAGIEQAAAPQITG